MAASGCRRGGDRLGYFFYAPTRLYAGFEAFKNPDTILLGQFLAVVAKNYD
jgi:hypothetical protein